MFTGMSEIMADKHRIDELEKKIETLNFKVREARAIATILRDFLPAESVPLGVDPIIEEWDGQIP